MDQTSYPMSHSAGACDDAPSVSDLLVEKKRLQDQLEAPLESAGQAITVSNGQLAEVKNMRNPVDVIRRTLAATWLLLHAQRFEGRQVNFDEIRDWTCCQNMLADDNFIASIQGFQPSELDSAPHVPHYVATQYLGFTSADTGGLLTEESSSSMPRYRMSKSEFQSQMLKQYSKAAITSRSTLASSGQDLLRRKSDVPAAQKPKLTLQTVERASKTCALLLQWMLGVVREHTERQRLKRRLSEVEALLSDEGHRPNSGESEASAAAAPKISFCMGHPSSAQQVKDMSKPAYLKLKGIAGEGTPPDGGAAGSAQEGSILARLGSQGSLRRNPLSSTSPASLGLAAFAAKAEATGSSSKGRALVVAGSTRSFSKGATLLLEANASSSMASSSVEPLRLSSKTYPEAEASVMSTSPMASITSNGLATPASAEMDVTTPSSGSADPGAIHEQTASSLNLLPGAAAPSAPLPPQTPIDVKDVKLIGEEAARVLRGSPGQITFSRVGSGPLAEHGSELEADHVEKVLPRILRTWGIFKKWKLKLCIEGHQDEVEKPGRDLERSRAVRCWFLAQGCEPWQLREKAYATSKRLGTVAVAAPVQELVAKSGPLAPELASLGAQPGLFFESNSAVLLNESKSVVRAMGDWLYTFGADLTFHVEGHALAWEDRAESLAKDRAEAVAELLMRRGVKAHQLITVSLGSTCPVTSRPDHDALNRRVELLMAF
eukprot:TRINITY_DN24921_c0_g1_i1.p1 TRINITY_DN24921_c0_g1~~TRINITY_DN24921_c0_g1_i1.p1  ORF type:complete len:718 (+),score=163.42 TRINITY_DN24921_c0_g1_i1:51-2204(+)